MRKTILALSFVIVGCGSSSNDAPAQQQQNNVDAGPDVSQGECTCPDDGNPCTFDQCNNGKCEHPPVEAVIACPGGKCHAGQCCKGCWDGVRCAEGTDKLACGAGGVTCDSCNDSNNCTADICGTDHKCKHEPAAGTCPNGVCVEGECKCGDEGQPCCNGASCNNGLPCANGTCGNCGAQGQSCCPNDKCASDANACVNGKCETCGKLGEACCANSKCADGSVCDSHGQCVVCGGPGQACCAGDSCSGFNNCTQGVCTSCGEYGKECCKTGKACQGELNGCYDGKCDGCFTQLTSWHAGTCALKRDGRAWCWGNDNGMCSDHACELTLDFAGMRIRHLAGSQTHVCVVGTDNYVYCKGYNGHGQLGIDNGLQASVSFVRVSGEYTKVFAGHSSTCALGTAAELFCWGLGFASKSGVLADQILPKLFLAMPQDYVDLSSLEYKMPSPAAVAKDGQLRRFDYDAGAFSAVNGITGATWVGFYPDTPEPPYTLLVRRSDNTLWFANPLGGGKQILAGIQDSASGYQQGYALREGGQLLYSGFIGPVNSFKPGVGWQDANGYADVIDVSAGFHHACVRRRSGVIECWGNEDLDALSLGFDRTNNPEGPGKVVGLSCE